MKLTNRETEVISLMSNGLIGKDIAKELKISVRTVETHRNRIYVKLGVHNRVQAVTIFLKHF